MEKNARIYRMKSKDKKKMIQKSVIAGIIMRIAANITMSMTMIMGIITITRMTHVGADAVAITNRGRKSAF